MSLGEIIAKQIGKKIAANIVAKRDAQKEALVRGEITEEDIEREKAEKKAQGMFKQFWSLDVKKNFGQSFITYMFYSFVIALMDAVALFPIMNAGRKPEGFMGLIIDYPPSLFIGMALVVVVALGRNADLWKKGTAVLAALLIGLFLSSDIVLTPLLYLLMQPVLGGVVEEQNSDANEEVAATSIGQAGAIKSSMNVEASNLQDIQETTEPAVQSDEDPLAAFVGGSAEATNTVAESDSKPVEPQDEKPEPQPEEEKVETEESARPMGDGDVPDDYVDPIDEFLKKDS